MSVEENKAVARRFVEALFNQGKLEVVDEILAADFVDHSPAPGTTPGGEGIKQYISMVRGAFPDLRATEEHVIAEGDKVMGWVTFTGTHKGEYMGMAPTGNQIRVSVITILRFAGGKVVERWNVTDRLSLMQQLGILPVPGQG